MLVSSRARFANAANRRISGKRRGELQRQRIGIRFERFRKLAAVAAIHASAAGFLVLDMLRSPAHDIDLVDTSGGGFAAGFMVGLSKGWRSRTARGLRMPLLSG